MITFPQESPHRYITSSSEWFPYRSYSVFGISLRNHNCTHRKSPLVSASSYSTGCGRQWVAVCSRRNDASNRTSSSSRHSNPTTTAWLHYCPTYKSVPPVGKLLHFVVPCRGASLLLFACPSYNSCRSHWVICFLLFPVGWLNQLSVPVVLWIVRSLLRFAAHCESWFPEPRRRLIREVTD